jgi:signal transduction histidine kinase
LAQEALRASEARRRALEAAMRERERELSTLLSISQSVGSTLEMEPLMGLILDELRAVVDYTAASVRLLFDANLVMLAYRGPNPDPWRQATIPLAYNPLNREVIDRRQAIIISDTHSEQTPLAGEYRDMGEWLQPVHAHVRSWMGVPLVVRQQILGLIILNHHLPHYYTIHHAEIAHAFANHAAAAVQNARLYAQTVQQARDVGALYRADEELHRSLRLDDVLQALVDVVTGILQADKAAVHVWDPERGRLVTRASRGFDPQTVAEVTYAPGEGIAGNVFATGKPIWVEDVPSDPRIAPTFVDREQVRSVLSVPIKIGEHVFGVFGVNFCQPRTFSDHDVRLFSSLAQRAALAIENARLYEQAQHAAGLQERQRLARELHDSVSQALYGIALGARTARTLLDRDPPRAVQPVEYILSLAEAGIAEMRALIFELRPESLENEGLVAALQKHAASLRARYAIDVVADLGDEPDMPFSVKEAFYRIAQEALHNTVKHAQAQHITLRLESHAATVALEVQDDGIGFDPTGNFPGHLGLKSMRERMERLGGTLTIESAPGAGTRVYATIERPRVLTV